MLNTKKLLYILPDVAYIAELLPGKKPATFSISAFHQVNGEYLDDNTFIDANLEKLFEKIDPAEYQVILPDFLFTNTIVNVEEKSDAKIKTHLTQELLPKLDLSPETHHLDTTVLNEHGDKTRVQLSALEKEILTPLQLLAEKKKIKIKTLSPLSWSIKSLVSLEPSISVIQLDSMLYIALHYIGVDQASQASVNEVENIYETIKTLKGSEPSIQTVYLLSNELVEEKLKEHLSDTLPIQQLASKQDDKDKMPAYVKKIIEAGMRTLSISDYPVPQFILGKAPAGARLELASNNSKEEEKSQEKETKSEDTSLPQPTKSAPLAAKKIEKKEEKTVKVNETDLNSKKVLEKKEAQEDDQIDALLKDLKINSPQSTAETSSQSDSNKTAVDEKLKVKTQPNSSEEKKAMKKVITNKNKTKDMFKMVFVTLAVFFATVGIGIGIGLGVLKLSQKEPSLPTEIETPIASTNPTPIPTPSPSPTPEVKTASMSALVVNATTKAGYAGEIADLLTDLKTVKASNAKGDYDPGLYFLMETQNQALMEEIETMTGQTYTFQTNEGVEDPAGQYDFVIVLAE